MKRATGLASLGALLLASCAAVPHDAPQVAQLQPALCVLPDPAQLVGETRPARHVRDEQVGQLRQDAVAAELPVAAGGHECPVLDQAGVRFVELYQRHAGRAVGEAGVNAEYQHQAAFRSVCTIFSDPIVVRMNTTSANSPATYAP